MLVDIKYPDPVTVDLEASKTLLIIVDMENCSAHPNGPQYMGEPVEKIIPRIAQLRSYVRARGGQVLHTQSVRKRDALEFTVFKNVVRKLEGTWDAEFIDALKPAADEPVVVKHTHDCFYQTNMAECLQRLGIRPGEGRVIVTGIASRGCVQCAVTGLSIRDYYVYVPMDCTAAKDETETLLSFSLYRGFGYRYNVTMTQSDMITLQPATVTTATSAPVEGVRSVQI
ncbi:MAG TPA: isochorismatase family cysteine hydrolase [Candidatus Limnocylindrales bacterium]|nr:isochorismatase family cysteine hydrolase [Candidatus Limnocylindrales bacterium]